MIVTRIELVDYRNYVTAAFDLTPGITAVVGRNGQGKTNFAEALGYLSTLDSFRGAPAEALIRAGADAAVIRATVRHDDGRELSIEAELSRSGRNRVLVNRQKLPRTRDLLGVVRVSVFSPDDLALVKEGPSERRRFLDDTLVALALKYDAMRLELDRVVKQRNTLLKQAAGRLDEASETTLDVWDAKYAELGDRFGQARAVLIARLGPIVQEAYEHLAGVVTPVELRYEPVWRTLGLAAALAAARHDDVRRGVSTVGPHRDDVELVINGMPARTHASQGEQRTLALSLRLGAHRFVTEHTGSAPVLILDDVLSELDDGRATALLHHLPPGQVVLTSASALPPAARPDAVVRIEAGASAAEGSGTGPWQGPVGDTVTGDG
ncbi:MAG: DNA replication/repair protein RecF [Acidimicrobiales bacterium]|nr:DNA replication/repair protein RecF [Acidimicrobiales bacterium]MCB9392946.1 DNA replication/repair protein RecF [Acidimicrobiaceae bacterium]